MNSTLLTTYKPTKYPLIVPMPMNNSPEFMCQLHMVLGRVNIKYNKWNRMNKELSVPEELGILNKPNKQKFNLPLYKIVLQKILCEKLIFMMDNNKN